MKLNTKAFFGVLLVMALVMAGCSGGGEATSTPATLAPTATTASGGGNGKVVIGVSDAAADMGAVTEVKVTIDSVKLHQQGGAWVTAATGAKTFDLLKLEANGTTELLAQADLKAGTYDQFELNVTKVVVVDASGEAEAQLPSNKLQFKTTLEVVANATATADLDFQTDESLHVTGEGKYILAPVIEVETRSSATAKVEAAGTVELTGGRVTSDSKVGMDIHGNVDAGLMISPGAVLSISGGKLIQTKGEVILRGTIKSVDAAAGTVTISSVSGAETVVKVGADSKISLGGLLTTIASLGAKVGSEAVVKYDAESMALVQLSGSGSASTGSPTSPTATPNVTPAANATVSGTLKAVNVVGGTVTITTSSGEDVVLKIGSDTKAMVSGAVVGTASLVTKIGSQVSATYNMETKVAASISATS
ncbi:MAG: hypothetical protein HW397_255 [Dehalococcoidia bacterium]|nr:hypothetical protein [Dehalococcoidia bacterium]